MKRLLPFISALLLSACAITAHVTSDEEPIPKKVLIEVPFSPQAPHANWDAPYQEACEEMALIMAHYFLEGLELTREIADKEILEMVAWEEANEYPEDVTLTQLAQIGCEYYGHCSLYVINKPSIDSIKEQLALGNPVIVPAAGRDLLNPYYSGEGPWYHMLLIKGYDRNEFITNDPGTKRGDGFKFKYKIVLDAIHDWTGVKEEIREGDPVMLVVRSE